MLLSELHFDDDSMKEHGLPFEFKGRFPNNKSSQKNSKKAMKNDVYKRLSFSERRSENNLYMALNKVCAM
jgi:NAD+--asparagine ADP-ribosyltransferase